MPQNSESNNMLYIEHLDEEESSNVTSNIEKTENEAFQIRCPDCFMISSFKGDFKESLFSITCDNHHTKEYNSFSSFLIETKIVCNGCQKSIDGETKFKCNICNSFFCNECKNNHMDNHDSFEEISKVDSYCSIHNEKYQYYNLENQSHICKICYNNLNNKNKYIKFGNFEILEEKINKGYSKVLENIQICKNIKKSFNEWLKELNKKFDNYFEMLKNYYQIQKSLLNFLKNSKNIDIYSSNINSIMNYQAFKQNNVDENIQKIKTKIINNNSSSFEKILQLLKVFNQMNFIVNCEKTKEEYLSKNSKNEKEEKNEKRKKNEKIPKLKIRKNLEINIDSEIKCFSSLNEDKYLALGLKSGIIEIHEIKNGEQTTQKLRINEFENEINLICELDINLFAATDGKKVIKIIELKNNITEYKVIQELNIMEDSGKLYTMINLPALSNRKNRHYFCTGDEKHILIWKSNKNLKKNKMKELGEQEENGDNSSNYSSEEETENEEKEIKENEPLSFSLVKDIELNTLARCLIEVCGKYIAVACTRQKSLKFFDIEKNFEEITQIRDIPFSSGKSILTLMPKKNILIIGCKDGFRLISTEEKIKLSKEITCKYTVTSLKAITENSILCFTSDGKKNAIKQYQINSLFNEFSKVNEKNVYKDEVWNFKIIDNKVFYNNGKEIKYIG